MAPTLGTQGGLEPMSNRQTRSEREKKGLIHLSTLQEISFNSGLMSAALIKRWGQARQLPLPPFPLASSLKRQQPSEKSPWMPLPPPPPHRQQRLKPQKGAFLSLLALME